MANFTVENINNAVQSGDVSRLFGTMERVSPEQPGQASPAGGPEHLGSAAAPGAGKTFSDILTDSMEKVNLYQHESDSAIKELVAGRNKNIHETMLTIERADTSLKLMMQVRNKILDAYREIMRMQV
jgi:flagellar hook-basal body complex protein FliE